MNQQKDKFGETSIDDVKQQMNMYQQWDSLVAPIMSCHPLLTLKWMKQGWVIVELQNICYIVWRHKPSYKLGIFILIINSELVTQVFISFKIFKYYISVKIYFCNWTFTHLNSNLFILILNF